MHVRVSSVTRRGNTYQYAQLVESVRRERDGKPVHRVVANLGRIADPVQLENLKAAFVANRTGQRLAPVVAGAADSTAESNLDLGMVQVPVDETEARDAPLLCSEALRIGLGLLESVACRKSSTHAAAARAQGLSTEKGHQYRLLARLDADQQEQVLAGQVDGHPVNRLLNVARQQDEEQRRAALVELMGETPSASARAQSQGITAQRQHSPRKKPQRVRVVAYFNPEVFVRQRWLAQGVVVEMESEVRKLNERLSNPRSKLKAKGALQATEEKLRRHDLLNVFEVEVEMVEAESGPVPQLKVTRNEAQWQRRRSFDGFSVLVAHPNVKRSAADLTRTYRAKNAVEADFHVIKSVMKLRPVRHRTDEKVRAHVVLCMLALTVQRELTTKLQKEGVSAEQALEQLEPCRLSLYPGKGHRGDAYVLPKVGREELGILRRLGLTRLVEERELAVALTPRSEFVSTETNETA